MAKDIHDQINDYQRQLDKGMELQELMKNANIIIKKFEVNKIDREQAKNQLTELGLSSSQADKIFEPDFMGRKGFATYQLTNNNANNKRIKDRIEVLKKKLQGAKAVQNSGQAEEYIFDGGTIEVNYEIDRVQILFPGGRVDKELFKKLRSNGYVYSPTNQAFQRKITPQAIQNAIRLFDAKKVTADELEKGIEVESEHKDTLEKVASGEISTEQAPEEIAKDHLIEDTKYYDKLDEVEKKPISNKKYVKVKVANNHAEKGSIGEVIKKPNMFVTEVYFGKNVAGVDIIRNIDNTYLEPTLDPIVSTNGKAETFIERKSSTPEPKKDVKVTNETHLEPNTPEEFDEAIFKKLDVDKDHEWIGNLMKQRGVLKLLNIAFHGPENEKEAEVQRLFKAFYEREKANPKYEGTTILKYDPVYTWITTEPETEPIKRITTIKESISSKPLSQNFIADVKEQVGEPTDTHTSNHGHTTRIVWGGLFNTEVVIDDQNSPIAPGIYVKRNNVGKNFELNHVDKAINYFKELHKTIIGSTETEKEQPTMETQTEPTKTISNPTGLQEYLTKQYDNQYQLNKGIEEFMTTKGAEPSTYSAEEKAFIKKYSGYGGLSKFGLGGKGAFFEYYTPTPVIRKMWALAYKYGYKGGSILESSVGTGEFLPFAPKDASITAYEINPFSADICRILYPQAKVITQPFEQNFIENNYTVKDRVTPKYDLCIGNPPYGSFEVVKSRYLSDGMGEFKHVSPKNYAEYFLRRSLDLLKPGGLLILIIGADVINGGTLFLDSGPSVVKDYLAEHSDLLDAYRLPDSVFERTAVTTEIVVLQKK